MNHPKKMKLTFMKPEFGSASILKMLKKFHQKTQKIGAGAGPTVSKIRQYKGDQVKIQNGDSVKTNGYNRPMNSHRKF